MIGVYAIRHVSGAVYIGSSKTVEARLRSHRSKLQRGQHLTLRLQALWSRDGEASFSTELIECCAISVLKDREQFWADAEPDLLNATRHVKTGSLDPVVAKKIGDALRGKPKPFGFGEAISAAQKGVACPARSLAQKGKPRPRRRGEKRSAETRAKMSASMRGNRNGLGAKHSPESVARSKAAHLGAKRSAETRERLRLSHLGKRPSRETRRKQGLARRGQPQPWNVGRHRIWTPDQIAMRTATLAENRDIKRGYAAAMREGEDARRWIHEPEGAASR